MTDTEPRIAWLPGINDGPISRYVDMDKRRKEIEVLVAEREEADAARTREMDEEVVSKKARRQMLRDARDAEHVQAEVKPQEPAAEVDCDLLGQDLSEGHEDEDENEN